MNKLFARILLASALLAAPMSLYAQTGEASLTRVGGTFVASNYGKWNVQVASGNSATGTASITLKAGSVTLPDGRVIVPFSTSVPITIDTGSSQETVTPTAVTNCYAGAQAGVCTITADFTYTHGTSTPVRSGTYGLAEAVLDAANSGGGVVAVDSSFGGTTTTLVDATANANVWLLSTMTGSPTWYGKEIGGTTYSAALNDLTGTATLSGGAATVDFSKTYATAPTCVATDQTAIDATSAVASTSVLTLGGHTTDVLSYACYFTK